MHGTRILDYLDKTKEKKGLEPLFRLVFDHVLDRLGKEGDFEVSLSLLSVEEQKALNKAYRGIDKETDVLTFAYEETSVEQLPLVDLGTITICPEVAKRQAREFSHPYPRELCFLFIHGLLHIFGYDHQTAEESETMFSLQNELLNTLPHDFYTNLKRLEKELLKAQEKAIVPYSNFRVGAIVVTRDGRYIPGFNIENSSFPATCCAERVALYSAYAQGYGKDDIVSLGCITDSKNLGTCCGVCRQVMSELMHPYCPVYIYSGDRKKHLFTTVEGLLPNAFSKEDLQK
ncbi:MAG TPA: cytidine deaminase [Candidatus Enterosoma merdigallinarum]|nr:cytidine deaminase [Candidatus Enterosoma merdigallinarum]